MITPFENGLYKDEFGIQMPWYTLPALEVIDKWDFQYKFVYEYGVGYSTLWYLSRGASVYGVDSNKKWASFVNLDTVNHRDVMRTYTVDLEYGKPFDGYDVICIDGIWRDDCTEHALRCLKSGGKLILDNWKQPEVEPDWPKTEKLIEGMQIEVYKQPGHPDWQTAIVTKP